ncbi:MAG: helix-turn-helix domain-containing protein, partial [Candidatus Nezhaarchaeales archaeon]
MRIELSDGEIKVLKCLSEARRALEVNEVAEHTRLRISSVMSYLEALSQRGLVKILVEDEDYLILTDEGKKVAERGLPERRIMEEVKKLGGQATLQEVRKRSSLSDEEIRIALGWFRKKGIGEIVIIDGEKTIKVKRDVVSDSAEEVLKKLVSGHRVKVRDVPQEVLWELKARKLIEVVPQKKRSVLLTDIGLSVLEQALHVKVVGALTADMIKSGEWRNVYLKPYDVSAEPPRVYPARKHFYVEFLDRVRRILVEMGFVEADGPYVEMEFWNFDVLFQAQDHPAREIHDCFILLEPSKGNLPDRKLVERVKRIHEERWGYEWSEEQATRLILRSH